MRGRYPAGPEYIDKLTGSPESKERLKAILDTLSGEARLQEACDALGLGYTRFHQLRQTALQAALDALEPRPPGRPSRATACEAEPVRLLQQRVAELENELHVAELREEIAVVLHRPHRTAGPDHAAIDTPEGKKTPPNPVRIRKPR
jgi:hypothetical protein